MKIHVCDLCVKKVPDAKLKYKYRAKQSYIDIYGKQWATIELCQECLEKIINATKGDGNEKMQRL